MKTLNEFLINKHVSDIGISKDEQDILLEYIDSRFWKFPVQSHFYKVEYSFGLDKDGFYMDTEGQMRYTISGDLDLHSFDELFNEGIDKFNKYDNKKCPKFRWRNHIGQIILPENLQNLSSISGLPQDIELLFINDGCCGRNKQLDLTDHNIEKIVLVNVGQITLLGKPNVKEIVWKGWDGIKPNITFNCKNMHKE